MGFCFFLFKHHTLVTILTWHISWQIVTVKLTDDLQCENKNNITARLYYLYDTLFYVGKGERKWCKWEKNEKNETKNLKNTQEQNKEKTETETHTCVCVMEDHEKVA